MSATANLWLYFVVVFGIIVLPGLDMAFVMGSSVLGGRRAGFAAVAGIVAGGFCHLAMSALGIAAVLRWFPALFQLMLIGGAGYLAWIGIALLRADSIGMPGGGNRVASPEQAFRRAIVTSLVNPKAYLFMLAIFPQFLRPGQGPFWVQSLTLGAITSLTQVGVYGLLAVIASQAGTWLHNRPRASLAAARMLGALLVAVAVLTAMQLFNAPPVVARAEFRAPAVG